MPVASFSIAIATVSAMIPQMIPEPENTQPTEDQPKKFEITGDDDLSDEPLPRRQCDLDDGQEGCPVCE